MDIFLATEFFIRRNFTESCKLSVAASVHKKMTSTKVDVDDNNNKLAAQATYREAIEHLFDGRRQQAWLSLAYSPIRRREVKRRIPNEIIVFLPPKKLKMWTTTSTDTTKKKAGGRKAGTGNYTRDELTHLLDILERRLPIGPEEWEACLLDHTAVYPKRTTSKPARFAPIY